MNFQHPLAWSWLLLAIPIVIFYILKIRLRRVPVSTTLFWRRVYDEKQPRSLWQKLRHLISLFLQLLFLLLVAFALTDPHFAWEALESRRIVIIVDNSASMQATDAAPTRLDVARDRCRKIVEGLRFRDEVAVVAAAAEPRVVCGLTQHRRTLKEALQQITPTDGPTSVLPAVELARRLLGDHPRQRIYVATDAGFADWESLIKQEHVVLLPVGQATANIGITQFQVRRSLLDPLSFQILAEVLNAGPEKIDCRLTVSLAGDVIDVVPLHLEPGQALTKVFDKSSTEGGVLLAELDVTDALTVDNRAHAVLPGRTATPIQLVTRPNLFLEKVLEANPLVRLTVRRDLKELAAASGPVGQGGVTVLHRQVPEKLPPGPVFVIAPEGSCDLWTLGEPLENPIVSKQDKDSLYMTHVRVENVLMPAARKLQISGEHTSFITAESGEPLYVLIRREAGPVLVLTVDLDKGDLPLRTAFPIMATNAIAQLTGGREELREALAAGAVATIRRAELPVQSGPLSLVSPRGQAEALTQPGETLLVGPLLECGLWKLLSGAALPGSNPAATQGTAANTSAAAKQSAGSEDLLTLAVNLSSRAESEIRVPQTLLDQPAVVEELAGWSWRPPWFQATLVALVLMTLEWFLYQRRWIT